MEITASTPLEREKNQTPSTFLAANGRSPPIHLPPAPPLTPSPRASISHDAASPYSTTFVQADTSNFKQVVQMLTGSSETARHAAAPPTTGGGGIPPIKSTSQKKQGFKLYERRNRLTNGLMINTLLPTRLPSNSSGFSPRKAPEILSPSTLNFPSLALSPPTPLNGDNLSRSAEESPSSTTAEEKAIAEKKFYFHPSLRTSPGKPQLLPLFPVSSPRVPGSEN